MHSTLCVLAISSHPCQNSAEVTTASASSLTPYIADFRLFTPKPHCISRLTVTWWNIRVIDIKSNCENLRAPDAAHSLGLYWKNCGKEFGTSYWTSFFFFTKTLHLILNRLVIAHIVLLNRALFVSKSDHVSQKCVACCLFSGFLLTDSAAHFLCLLTALDS